MVTRRMYAKRKALGDGNCAFNAFIIGLHSLVLSDWLDDTASEYQDFLEGFSGLTGEPATWNAFKAYFRAHSLLELQKNLAGLMREFSMNLIRFKASPQTSQHYDNTLELIHAAFDAHVRKIPTDDDIMRPLSFVQDKFEAIVCQSPELALPDPVDQAIEQKQADITQWWVSEGYETFLNEMQREGQWVGDLEIAPLAEYFQVNLDVKRVDSTHRLHEVASEEERPTMTLVHGAGHWDCLVESNEAPSFQVMRDEAIRECLAEIEPVTIAAPVNIKTLEEFKAVLARIDANAPVQLANPRVSYTVTVNEDDQEIPVYQTTQERLDAILARQLQAEEDALAQAQRAEQEQADEAFARALQEEEERAMRRQP